MAPPLPRPPDVSDLVASSASPPERSAESASVASVAIPAADLRETTEYRPAPLPESFDVQRHRSRRLPRPAIKVLLIAGLGVSTLIVLGRCQSRATGPQ